MRRTLFATGLLLAIASSVWAQTAVSPSPQEQLAFYQKAVATLQAQRNKAEDDVAQATAQAQVWKEQLDAARAEVKTLQERLAAAQPASPVPPPSGAPAK